MKTRLLSAACLLLAAGVAGAELENLRSVACDPDDAVYPSWQYSRTTSKPGADSGVVNERAMEFVFDMARRRVHVAIDSSEAGMEAPDIVRLDFSGRGRYDGAPTVPLTARGAQLQIGPADIEAEVDGRTLNIRVEGNYVRHGDFRRMGLRLGTALEGEVDFGDESRRVRLIDGVGNLRFGNSPTAETRGQVSISSAGDTVAVLRPDSDIIELRQYYGQPVRVADQWYELKLSNDMTSLSAAPVEIQTGRVEFPALDEWSAVLWGRHHVVFVEAPPEPGSVEVPADRYVVFGYSPRLRVEGDDRPAQLMRRDVSGPQPGWKPVVVEPDRTVAVEVGPPLVATPNVRRSGRDVRVSLGLTDAAGVRIVDVRKPGGHRPDPPKLQILDEDGTVVHSGAMEYG